MRGSNVSVSGTVLYNMTPNLSSFSNAYVIQTDVLLPDLSVRETLQYAASLRLPSSTTKEQRRQLVEEVILELGLKECADTRVGDGVHRRGCSGGERRRVSIGVQMLGNPSILFLDEPTTGLDATSAFHLVNTLKHLANNGRTIIITIHQPRSDIFFLFDRVTLLSKGHTVYSGPTKDCLHWFDTLIPGGLKPHINPADYLIDMSMVDSRTPEAEAETRVRVDRLLTAWKAESDRVFSDHHDDATDAKSKFDLSVTVPEVDRVQHSASLWHQIYILTHRSITTTVRDPLGLIASWVGAIAMGITGGLIFYHIPRSLSGIRSREGALYISTALQVYFVLLFETFRLTASDMALFDRERGEGVIGVVAWMISRRIAHGILEDFIVPLIFSVTFYFLCGFESSVIKFGTYFSVLLLHQYIAVSFALLAAAISRDFAIATMVANMFTTFQTFSSGFYVQAATIPVYIKWTKWISFVVRHQ
jgi:ABC-type multidrug transport system ATPase subunit